MLSKVKMVNARRAIESLYDGTCTITEHKSVKKTNMSTGFVDEVVFENQPCRLSYKTVNQSSPTESASKLVQVVKVFLAPEIQVKPGSKLTITQCGVTTDFKCSGQPAFYRTHQEIVLELFQGWS